MVFESGMCVSRVSPTDSRASALVPRDGNPTRKRGVDCNPPLAHRVRKPLKTRNVADKFTAWLRKATQMERQVHRGEVSDSTVVTDTPRSLTNTAGLS